MDVTAAMLVEGGRQARLCEAFNWNAGAREWKPLGRITLGAPPGPSDRVFVSAGAGCKVEMERRKMAFTLSGASVCGRRGRAIRKTIIGHGVSASRKRFSRGNVLLPLLRAFPLLHQPAGQHGCGILLHPKVEKRANLLAEIGSMAETREFIALQRISRSREKKFPRRLGLVVVQRGLPISGLGTLTVS
jgi:hypothetical protein